MRAYASRTGTPAFLDAIRAAGWGLLISAYGVHRDEGFGDVMLDNGAWSAHTKGEPWESGRFEDLLDEFGDASAQTIAPDIVAGGRASLALSLAWMDRIPGYRLLAVQDGLGPADVRPYIGGRVGIAVGGSTSWKWRTVAMWCEVGRIAGCRVHVLRAGSARMVAWAKSCGAYSFDGSGPSQFGPDCLRRVNKGRTEPAQMTMTAYHPPSPFTPRDTK